jgi:NTP pyrophosphatase (non-canonical NTP hydrolase)
MSVEFEEDDSYEIGWSEEDGLAMQEQHRSKMSGKFIRNFKWMQEQVHTTAKAKGWHDSPRTHGEFIALMHSELSEALEHARVNPQNSKDDKLPNRPGVEVELADCIIRIMDYAEWHGFDVGGAIVAKADYNRGRSYRHGNKLL